MSLAMAVQSGADLLARARAAALRRDWVTAHEAFRAASELSPLSADDSFAAGDCAWWLGKVDEYLAASEVAYDLYRSGGQPRRAAMAAFGLAYTLSLRVEPAGAQCSRGGRQSGFTSRAP